MLSTLARTMFYPSLGYNMLLEKIGITKWYNEIILAVPDTEVPVILLGALPFKSMLAKMRAENVTRVISLNEQHELNATFLALPNNSDYKAYGIEQYQINVCDFTGAPSCQQIEDAIKFILESKGKVYVHCKAGRCRSAVIVVCLLLKLNKNLNPNTAFNIIRNRRSHIIFHEVQWRRVNEYYNYVQSIA